jgi:hypothetical protein
MAGDFLFSQGGPSSLSPNWSYWTDFFFFALLSETLLLDDRLTEGAILHNAKV